MATIYDEAGSQSVLGTSGGDVIYGGTSASPLLDTGDDILNGAGGNDTLYGGDGNDTLDGGGSYLAGTTSLFGGTGDDVYHLGSDGYSVVAIELAGEGMDTLVTYSPLTLAANIENLVLLGSVSLSNGATGNELANSITGSDGSNTLMGAAGDDTLIGGAGNDLLDGGTGSDRLLGGTGNDRYLVDAAGDIVEELAGEGTDTVESAVTWVLGNNLEHLTLSESLATDGTGNSLDNVLTGNSAANALVGNDGNDSLLGQAGVDTLIGGDGNDTLIGGSEADIIDGGAGVDTLSNWGMGSAFVVNLAQGTGPDSYTGIENVTGGGVNDSLTGDAGDNVLSGEGGRDTLTGGAGNDTLSGGPGDNDLLIGGTGDDVYVILFSQEKDFSDILVENPGEGTDTLQVDGRNSLWVLPDHFENLVFTGVGAYSNGTGNAADNTLIDLSSSPWSNSSLRGMEGNDSLRGGGGNDTLRGDSGIDTLDGGADNDLYIVGNTGDVVIELSGNGDDTVESSANWTMSEHLEHLTLTGSGAINGTGNDSNNVITGNASANSLRGEGGDDLLTGLGGGDFLDGGDGIDTVSYADRTTAISVDLASGIGSDTVAGVENVVGGSGNDTLAGNGADNMLDGGAGNDLLSGGTGNDRYIVTFGDTVNESADEGDDEVVAASGWTLSAHVERLTLIGSQAINGFGNELANTITGNAGNNRLSGGSGNDSLVGGAGNDTLQGEAGIDTAVGGTGNDEYTVDSIEDVVLEYDGDGNDTVLASASWTLGDHIEFLTLTGTAGISGTGNAQANTLGGNTGANLLAGLAGNDTLLASAGGDTLDGGSDNDTVSYAGFAAAVSANLLTGTGTDNYIGVENLLGGSGDDTLTGDGGDNILDGGNGADSLTGGAGNDTYRVDSLADQIIELANEGIDTLETSITGVTLAANLDNLLLTGTGHIGGTGNAIANTLTGNTGDNALTAGAGNDVLIGGAGNDTLQGNSGVDTLSGGAGNDVYVIDYNTSDVVIELANEGIDLVQSAFKYTLKANVENLVLTGTANISGIGNALDNSITGNAGNNRLESGGGIDTLAGGLGDDTYVISHYGVVVELAGEGTDTVKTGGNLGLSYLDHVENLVLTGQAYNGTGNALDNHITGNKWQNTLDGLEGADTLAGQGGNDTYYVDSDDDVVVELAEGGKDSVFVSVSWTLAANVEELYLDAPGLVGTGSAGDDILHDYLSDSVLIGGDGNDHYYLHDTATSTVEMSGGGTDTVYLDDYAYTDYLLGDNIENLVLLGYQQSPVTGNSLGNAMAGSLGDNTMDGGGGDDFLHAGKHDSYDADLLVGGDGNDTLYGNNGDDTCLGGAGNDVLHAGIRSYFSQNWLDGGAGNDTMTGQYGQDVFVVDSAGDVLRDGWSEEWGSDGGDGDIVLTSVSWTLGARFEHLEGAGDAALTLRGNAGENVISCNDAGNTVYGLGGWDAIHGGDGDDYLNAGADGGQLTGGGGGDRFIIDRFVVDADSPWYAEDLVSITDFSHDQPDEYIRLDSSVFTSLSPGTLSNDNFAYNRPAQDANDFILYYTGGRGELYYDPDGSGSVAPVQLAWLENDEVITANDIKIV